MSETRELIFKAASLFNDSELGMTTDLFLGDLQWDKSKLIDQAADIFWRQITASMGPYCIDRVWLERIISMKVKDGYLHEGEMDWTVHLASPGTRGAKSITVPYAIHNGIIEEAKYFIVPSGGCIPLTPERLQNYLNLGIRPGW